MNKNIKNFVCQILKKHYCTIPVLVHLGKENGFSEFKIRNIIQNMIDFKLISLDSKMNLILKENL